MEMEDEMETRVRVCEDGVELEFGLEKVEFCCGQDGPVCGSDLEPGSEESAYCDRTLERRVRLTRETGFPLASRRVESHLDTER